MSNPLSLSMNVPPLEKCTDHIYTLIGLKCQSMRSKVHCTNKTLHKNRKKREGSRESAFSVYGESDNQSKYSLSLV